MNERAHEKLLGLFKKTEGLYARHTGKTFRDLRQTEAVKKTGNILKEAVKEIQGTGKDVLGDVDAERSWQEMSLADVEAFSTCLKFSLKDAFLLVHYNDRAMWGNTALGKVEDVWKIYDGLLLECRSAVINLDAMEYAMLPFAKFRNLNEAPEYSLECIMERMKNAKVIEFSEKLDGSFIQMRYLGDERLYCGILISSSGMLDASKSFQLAAVIAFLDSKGKKIKEMVTGMPEITFVFEWIDEEDPHVVEYPLEMQGLHLIGMRHTGNGHQYSYGHVLQTANAYGVPTTKLYSMTLDEVLSSLKSLKGSEREGYVLNVDGFLVKIKCPDFLELFRTLEMNYSFYAIAKAAADGNADDYISMLPKGFQAEARKKLRKILTYEQDIVKRVEDECERIPEGMDRKAAMIELNKIQDKFIGSLARQRYLGKPVNVIGRKKGASIQYVKESEIDEYYKRQGKA